MPAMKKIYRSFMNSEGRNATPAIVSVILEPLVTVPIVIIASSTAIPAIPAIQ